MPRLLTFLVALTAGTMVLAADPAEKKDGDLAKLAGSWKTMTGPDKDVPLTLKIEGNKITVKIVNPDGENVTVTGEFKLDESATPKAIDFVNFKLPDGKVSEDILAIYTLDGDEFQVCSSEAGEQRPEEFKNRDNGPPNLFVFKREPAAAK
jgi:uncharacterized protein (TIGR03067 family)